MALLLHSRPKARKGFERLHSSVCIPISTMDPFNNGISLIARDPLQIFPSKYASAACFKAFGPSAKSVLSSIELVFIMICSESTPNLRPSCSIRHRKWLGGCNPTLTLPVAAWVAFERCGSSFFSTSFGACDVDGGLGDTLVSIHRGDHVAGCRVITTSLSTQRTSRSSVTERGSIRAVY